MMLVIEKIHEWGSNLWVKIIAIIPLCFFELEDREAIMITALLIIITVDCFFGAMVAAYINHDFCWGKLGKKFSKKFLLFFFTLFASFIISNAYEFVNWWFYVIGTIITFSEFGSLMTKSKKLGLPIKNEYIVFINDIVDRFIKRTLGLESSQKRKKK